MLTVLPRQALGKAENKPLQPTSYWSAPNHNPQKLEIPHIYLFGSYVNLCYTKETQTTSNDNQ